MGSLSPRLWQNAWHSLPSEYQQALPLTSVGTPQDVIDEMNAEIARSKGQPITLPNGVTFFTRDAVEKITQWVKKFVEVGDVVVQYDPGHASLPWAALRMLLQASINNQSKRAAVLEGIDIISRWLVWGKIQEAYLDVHSFQTHSYLEQTFEKLYGYMLTFMARSLKFIQTKTSKRIFASFFSSDSKFRSDIDRIVATQEIIHRYTSQIFSTELLNHNRRLSEIQRTIEELQRPFARIETSSYQTLDALTRTQQNAVLDWASDISYEKHYKNLIRKVLPGTGKWLFQDQTYFAWQNTSCSEILWLSGGAGFGKSTLISMVIRSLIEAHESSQTPYPIFFYCSRNRAEPERADAECILRSLMRQASDLPGGPPLHQALRDRFDQRRIAGDISIEEATGTILSAIADRPTTFIIIDALDECNLDNRELILESLERILQESDSMVKIFITSRDNNQDISSFMENYSHMCIDANRNHRDIETYVRDKVEQAARKRKLLPTEGLSDVIRRQIEESLCRGAQGMFRWVELQLEFLYSLRVPAVLLARLGKLPPSLEQSYRDLYELKMRELGESQAGIVKHILSWLLIAQRQLKTKELRELVLAGNYATIANETVLEICFSLVSLDVDQDYFLFSHPSVKEFLETQSADFQISTLHEMASSACLDLVLQGASYSADDYAAVYWPIHAEFNKHPGETSQARLRRREFLCSNPITFSRWSERIYKSFQRRHSHTLTPAEIRVKEALTPASQPSLLCASFGLDQELAELATHENSHRVLKTENDEGACSLYLASQYGHCKTVQILIERGANVDSEGGQFGTALQAASFRGHQDVVRLLLSSNADVNSEGGEYGSALQAASFKGFEPVVRILLDDSATKINIEGGIYGSALQAACAEGHYKVVKMLLDSGADTNVQGGMFGSALQAAANNGHQDIVRILLQNGADPNMNSGLHINALHAALFAKHQGVVKVLLEGGMNVDTRDERYGSAIHAAAFAGFQEIVRLLMDSGANANAEGGQYGSALQAASFKGYEDIVDILLEHGADVNIAGGYYGSALQAASSQGHQDIATMLLQKGANINADGGYYSNALYAASAGNYLDVVNLLLAKGIDVNAEGGYYGNTLQAASARGQETLVMMLLEADANINAEGGAYGYALQAAASEGHLNIVKTLLSRHPNLDTQGGYYGTALQAAAYRGNYDIARLLIEGGANVNVEGGRYGDALQAASHRGCEQIVQLLLDNGANLNATGGEYGCALKAALSKGHKRISEMLMSRGAGLDP